VAAAVRRLTTSVWLSSSKCSMGGKVCFLRLPRSSCTGDCQKALLKWLYTCLQELYKLYLPESVTETILLEKKTLEFALSDWKNMPTMGTLYTPQIQKDVGYRVVVVCILTEHWFVFVECNYWEKTLNNRLDFDVLFLCVFIGCCTETNLGPILVLTIDR